MEGEISGEWARGGSFLKCKCHPCFLCAANCAGTEKSAPLITRASCTCCSLFLQWRVGEQGSYSYSPSPPAGQLTNGGELSPVAHLNML